ncbi:MAG: flagellar basal body P-ring formation protein FlgA [Candidatus Eisenbacteria sp.]|nr:flagellar basal body P-ring formation protein FlgA [Candidatus Eisenbacteria bacterium]
MGNSPRSTRIHSTLVAALAFFALTTVSGFLSAEEISCTSVRAAAEDGIRRAFGDRGDVVVHAARIPELGDLEGQDLDIRCRLAGSPDARGPVLVSLDFWKGDEKVGRRSVSADVEVLRRVLVTAELLDRHALIEEGDIRFEEADVRILGGEFFTVVEDLVGRRTRRVVPEGRVVLAGDIEEVPVIERGAKILIVARIGGITIRATGKALQDGAAGESIDVRNERSGKRLRGIVVNKNLVEIELAVYPQLGG